MHGLDLSWPAKTVAFVVNYVIGLIGCALAFGFIRFSALPAADGSSTGALVRSALAALAYLVGWRLLVPYVQSCEPDPLDPLLFIRGVLAFVYGLLTVLLIFMLLS